MQQDAEALIGILAVLRGWELGGYLEGDQADQLAQRLTRVQPISPGSLLPSCDDLSPVHRRLDALNQRLRYALGEYDR